MSYPIGLQVLRGKVRGLMAAGSTLSSHIAKSKGKRKDRLWIQKRLLGTHCRYHLVAYGLLRFIHYEQIERCAPNNQLKPERILEIMLAHGSWETVRTLNLEKVKQLLGSTTALERSTTPGVVALIAVPVEKIVPVVISPTSPQKLPAKLFSTAKKLLVKRS